MRKGCATILWRRAEAGVKRALVGLVSLFLCLHILSEVHASENNVIATDYLFAESTIELPSELPREGWQPFDPVRSNLTPQKSKSLWIKFIISDLKSRPDRSLGFEKIFTRFKFFKNDELIESYGTAG